MWTILRPTDGSRFNLRSSGRSASFGSSVIRSFSKATNSSGRRYATEVGCTDHQDADPVSERLLNGHVSGLTGRSRETLARDEKTVASAAISDLGLEPSDLVRGRRSRLILALHRHHEICERHAGEMRGVLEPQVLLFTPCCVVRIPRGDLHSLDAVQLTRRKD